MKTKKVVVDIATIKVPLYEVRSYYLDKPTPGTLLAICISLDEAIDVAKKAIGIHGYKFCVFKKRSKKWRGEIFSFSKGLRRFLRKRGVRLKKLVLRSDVDYVFGREKATGKRLKRIVKKK